MHIDASSTPSFKSSFDITTMAGDTRDSNQPAPRGPPTGATEPPEHVKTPNKVYEVFHSPPQNANALPEGWGQNTAGGREKPPAITDAVKTIKLEDFKKVHMYPCVRESLLMGIGSGFGIGGIRALWGGMFTYSCLGGLLLIGLCCSSDTESCQLGGGNFRLCFVCQLRILSV
jgi:Protein of unknown function (DUF3767)